MNKRIIITIITGAILGIFCIIGATVRSTETLSTAYLFSFWFNRIIMGLVIGLLGTRLILWKRLVRGLIIGLFVSLAFYSATEFNDLMGFLAGGVYGVIIEFVAYKLEKNRNI
jgi:hypothetical protein